VISEQLVPMKELFGKTPAETPASFNGTEVIREIEESLGFICAGAEKMEALLKGLLVFSRLGRQKPELQILDAEKIVSQSLSATRFQIDEAEAEITVHSLPVCLGDPGLFGQIVSNLLDNALKYRDPARPLKLSISGFQQEALCVYRFQDNGIGIEPQHYERVFELFHRLNPRHSPGYGIGLAIVRRALDRMGGRVTVESVPHEGTVFSITLASGSPSNGKLFARN
jgi:signal transduction histidine kinase